MRRLLFVFVILCLAACAGPERPKPAPLAPNVPLLAVRTAWTANVGEVDFPLEARVVDNAVYLAGSAGTVAAIDVRTGMDVWRTQVHAPISAGVGSDGRFTAVVTRTNELVVLDGGTEAWRYKLKALTLTPPLVAGARVFTLSSDRTLNAFDAASGQLLWQQQRPVESLVLGQAGLLTAVGDTLVASFGGRVVGFNPTTGVSRWETAVVSPRGTNEIERLVDVVAGYARDGRQLCVRAFQYAVACVDAGNGRMQWNKAANGSTGIGGDYSLVYGSESDGRLSAWYRKDGEKAWTLEHYRFRTLSAPAVVGRVLMFGDDSGNLHVLSKDDGSMLTRIVTDDSGVAVTPVQAGRVVVVVSRRGSVYAYRPE